MSDSEFRIGRVLRQAVAAAWSNVARWLALAALVQAPIIVYMVSGLDQQLRQGPIVALVQTVAGVALHVIAQAALIAGMLAHLRGQRISLSTLLGTTLRQAPLLGFAIAYGLASALLVLPHFALGPWLGATGYMLANLLDFGCRAAVYVFFAVAVPVLVDERAGALAALQRSVFLTRNQRGRIFGLYFLIWLIQYLLFIPVIMWATDTGTTEGVRERMETWSQATMLLGPLVWSAINTSIYRALRLIREGVDIQSTPPSVPDARIHTSS